MSNVSLLDCTLRDGGYVNDWKFGNGVMTSISERLTNAKIDIIEVGFLDDRRQFDINRSIQPSTSCYKSIFGDIDKKGSKFVAMIDYGTCDISHIENANETIFDGIRLIFKIANVDGAIEYAKQLIEKGYDVFLQLVSITSYSDRDILDFVDKVNKISPYAVSIVDTYGLMHKEQVLHYFDLLDYNLNNDIKIGYHSHNNFQLGYANAIEFILRQSKHDKIVDGTLYGMGKSAGNGPLELIAMFLNDSFGDKYDMNQILEAIDNNILNIYQQKYWGYAFNYYVSALNDCHPNYVSYLLNKNTLSIKSINEILATIPCESKFLYNEKLAENLYRMYQTNDIGDDFSISTLKSSLINKKILLLGPGQSIISNADGLKQFIKDNDPTIIAVNYVSSLINSDYVFVSNSKRYNLMHRELLNYKGTIIATSNITLFQNEKSVVPINYNNLVVTENGEVKDNSLLLLLRLLIIIKVPTVYLAGFDGFSSDIESNYSDERLILKRSVNVAEANEYMKLIINDNMKKIKMIFLTPSLYN